jgi:hypothetical protein
LVGYWSGEHEDILFSNCFYKGCPIWMIRLLTVNFVFEVPFRGEALRHFPDGRWVAMGCGLWSLAGVLFNLEGYILYGKLWAEERLLFAQAPAARGIHGASGLLTVVSSPDMSTNFISPACATAPGSLFCITPLITHSPKYKKVRS